MKRILMVVKSTKKLALALFTFHSLSPLSLARERAFSSKPLHVKIVLLKSQLNKQQTRALPKMSKSTNGNKRLTLTLFRSLLRFTRQPHVVQSKFTLNPAEFRIDGRLPSSVYHIRNHTGVYGAISYLFRRSELIDAICVAKNKTIWTESERIDVCLDALKKLNQVSVQLKERHLERIKNSAFEVYSRAVYRIGQTLHHIPSGCRCVVVGWDVNLSTNSDSNINVMPSSSASGNPAIRMQRIQCVFDEEDSAELLRSGTTSGDAVVDTFHDITDFRPITDPVLVRTLKQSIIHTLHHYDILSLTSTQYTLAITPYQPTHFLPPNYSLFVLISFLRCV